MNAKHKFYLVLLKYALFIGICGGVCGIAVDIDHVPKYLGLTTAVRPAHLYLGIFAYLVACYCLAHLGRLFVGIVLKKKK